MQSIECEFFEDIFDSGHFRLNGQVGERKALQGITAKRDDQGDIIVSATTQGIDESWNNDYPKGTLYINDSMLELSSWTGIRVFIKGLEFCSSLQRVRANAPASVTEYLFSAHELHISYPALEEGRYTVDWLDNFERNLIFPHPINFNHISKQVTKYCGDDFIIKRENSERSFCGSKGLFLEIEGIRFFVCITQDCSNEKTKKAYILYEGTPNDLDREKIRECLSFCFGRYLIYLGSATFDSQWTPRTLKIVSAYSLERQAFSMPSMPPAPIWNTHEPIVDKARVARLIRGLYKNYDRVGFLQKSWAYWHALSASDHIAAAHYGALIESIQDQYFSEFVAAKNAKLLGRTIWEPLKTDIQEIFKKLEIDQDILEVLLNKVGELNKAPQNILLNRMFQQLGLELGHSERSAWKARNYAAHGDKRVWSDVVPTIKSNRLLQILVNRLILCLSDGAEEYYDYSSLNHPVRSITEAVP